GHRAQAGRGEVHEGRQVTPAVAPGGTARAPAVSRGLGARPTPAAVSADPCNAAAALALEERPRANQKREDRWPLDHLPESADGAEKGRGRVPHQARISA